MDSILVGIFVTALFQASEKIWEKSFDAAWEPVDSGLKERFSKLAGTDQVTERRKAFARASDNAQKIILKRSVNKEIPKKILNLLNQDNKNKDVVLELAEEAAKVLLLSDEPNQNKMTAIIQHKLRWESYWKNETAPSEKQILDVTSQYLANLRKALMDERVYGDLIQKEMLKTLQLVLQNSSKQEKKHDGDAEYLAQVIHLYQDLDFVGIPELKDRQSLRVDDIFIHLHAELD